MSPLAWSFREARVLFLRFTVGEGQSGEVRAHGWSPWGQVSMEETAEQRRVPGVRLLGCGRLWEGVAGVRVCSVASDLEDVGSGHWCVKGS